MANTTVYLKCDRNVEVQSEDVFMTDVGSLRCADGTAAARLKALRCTISAGKTPGAASSAP